MTIGGIHTFRPQPSIQGYNLWILTCQIHTSINLFFLLELSAYKSHKGLEHFHPQWTSTLIVHMYPSFHTSQGACKGKSHKGFEGFRWQPSACQLSNIRDTEVLTRVLTGGTGSREGGMYSGTPPGETGDGTFGEHV